MCRANKLTALDVSANKDLTKLTCDSNKITPLNVGSNTKLEYFNCYY